MKRFLLSGVVATAIALSANVLAEDFSPVAVGFVAEDGSIHAFPSATPEDAEPEVQSLAEFIAAAKKKPRINLGVQSVMLDTNLNVITGTTVGKGFYLAAIFRDNVAKLAGCAKLKGKTISDTIALSGLVTAKATSEITFTGDQAQCDKSGGFIWAADSSGTPLALSRTGELTVNHTIALTGYQCKACKDSETFKITQGPKK